MCHRIRKSLREHNPGLLGSACALLVLRLIFLVHRRTQA
jgi:hypothetical protein